MAVLMTPPKAQFFDDNGDPLAGGKIYFYTAGTSTPKDTYTNQGAGTPNANPVVLDSSGRADIWLDGSYKIVVKTSADVTISTTDNVTSFYGSASDTFTDSTFYIADNSDPTKKIQFQASSISSGATRVVTVPNANLTMVGEDTSQILTNKTLTEPALTTPIVTLDTETTITAAATVDLAGGISPSYQLNPRVLVDGTGASITSFGTASLSIQTDFYLRFNGVNTITHNGTNLILPGGANITTASGDVAIVRPGSAGGWRVINYQYATSRASAQSTPADPTGTSDTTGKMMGLAGSFTPTQTGRVLIVLSGSMTQGTNASGGKVQIRYGTGSAPANADALTGTAVGNIVSQTFTTAASARQGFSCNAVVSGLTVGTAYWIDAGLASITSGTASIKDISISAIEIGGYS